MDQPSEKPPLDLTNVGAIQNLETARMALRWALERIHALDREHALLEAAGRSKRQAELKPLQDEIAKLRLDAEGLRGQHERMKRFMSFRPEELQLGNKVDIEALNLREEDLKRVRLALDEREAGFAGILASRKLELEREVKHTLEALPEREARAERHERDLIERRLQLDESYTARREQLEHEAADLKSQRADEARLRAESKARHSALYEEWLKAKQSLRALTEPYPDFLEMDRRLSSAQEALLLARSAQAATDQKIRLTEIARDAALSLVERLERDIPAQISSIADLAKSLPQKIADLRTEHLWAREREEMTNLLESKEAAIAALQESLRAARKEALEQSVERDDAWRGKLRELVAAEGERRARLEEKELTLAARQQEFDRRREARVEHRARELAERERAADDAENERRKQEAKAKEHAATIENQAARLRELELKARTHAGGEQDLRRALAARERAADDAENERHKQEAKAKERAATIEDQAARIRELETASATLAEKGRNLAGGEQELRRELAAREGALSEEQWKAHALSAKAAESEARTLELQEALAAKEREIQALVTERRRPEPEEKKRRRYSLYGARSFSQA